MDGELNNVFLWLNSNKLFLNVKKTRFMVFSLRKHIITNTDLCINNQMIEIMNGELNNEFKWLNSNKLSLNVKKTQFMVFSLRKLIITNTDIGPTCA